MKSDWDIREAVFSELAWEPAVNESQIGVQVVGAVVILGGIVATAAIAAAALCAAHRVPGVKDVLSQLCVESVQGGMPDDLTLGRHVRRALAAAPAAEPELVRTTISDGIVSLSGVVHSEAARRAAGQVVGQVAGVKAVHNGLAVDRRAARIVVEDAVNRILERHASRSGSRPLVTIDAGRVHIAGPVASAEDRCAILAALRALPGVDAVEEQLVVDAA
jgi:osmotically-inducible protein OsmY